MKVLLIDGTEVSVVPAYTPDKDMLEFKVHSPKANCVLDGRNGKPIRKELIKQVYGNLILKF